MKTLLGGVVTFILIVTPARAQLLSRHWTNPRVPAARALARLNLQLAWRVYLPVEGKRDGIYSVQFAGKDIFAQTIGGVIVALDPRDGQVRWKTRVGRRFRVTHPLGFNDKSVFVVQGDHLYSLDRTSGKTEWTFILPSAATAGPVADDHLLFLCISPSLVYGYELPDLELLRKRQAARAKEEEESGYHPPVFDFSGGISGVDLEHLAEMRRPRGPEPEFAWRFLLETGRVQMSPVQTPEALAFITNGGSVYSTSKFSGSELFRYETDGKADAPLASYGDMAYIGSTNYNLYAMNVSRKSIAWRFICGAPIRFKPEVTDKDIFVVAERRGLYRVDRVLGKEMWFNREARRFLAVNKKFVYAFDRLGRLLVLDYKRGTRLGCLDTRAFVFPISNEYTDRLFLASHNGLLVCLRDRDQKEPLANKKTFKVTRVRKKEKGNGEKPKEKPKDDKKKPKDDDE
jgi:outer membrane protein assembly factor BamB